MKLVLFLSHLGIAFSNEKPIKIESNDQRTPADSMKVLGTNSNAYQRSWFWKISQKSNKISEMNKDPHVFYPKSMLKELAQQGFDISHFPYSRPPGGHQSNIERGTRKNGIRKWEKTIVHPETGKNVILVPFTFEKDFPAKDIIRGYLMDMNFGRFSNCRP